MLTGDSRATAEAVARALGIDQVHAGVLPDQKSEIVKQLQGQGRVVAMAATASTTHPRWRRPMSASPWAREPTLRSRAQESLCSKGICEESYAHEHSAAPPCATFGKIYFSRSSITRWEFPSQLAPFTLSSGSCSARSSPAQP